MVSHFLHLHNKPHNIQLPEKQTEIHWLRYDNNIPLLNAMKILTVRSVEDFNFLNPPVFGLWPACHKTQ